MEDVEFRYIREHIWRVRGVFIRLDKGWEGKESWEYICMQTVGSLGQVS